MSRDVKFMEDQQWSWDEPIRKQLPEIPQFLDDDVDDIPVRGTRSLSFHAKLAIVIVAFPNGCISLSVKQFSVSCGLLS